MADSKSTAVGGTPSAEQPGSGKKKQRGRGRQAAVNPDADGGVMLGSGEGGKTDGAAPSPSTEKVSGAAADKENQGGKTQDGDTAAPQKSKAQLRAERRAVQEAQRAAKAQKKEETGGGGGKGGAGGGGGKGGAGGGGSGSGGGKKAETPKKTEGPKKVEASKKQDQPPPAPGRKEPNRIPDTAKVDDPIVQRRLAKKLEKEQVPQRERVPRTVRLFNHLPQCVKGDTITEKLPFKSKIHPAVVKLGVQYTNDVVKGSNARCAALLKVLSEVIEDYVTPPQKELSRDLENLLKPNISFLSQCRPLAVTMGNAIKTLKTAISKVKPGTPDKEAKEKLQEVIKTYREGKIWGAATAIGYYATPKLKDDDVILICGSSSLILKVLKAAKDGIPNHQPPKRFRVIVVDSRPRSEGKEMMQQILKLGVPCLLVDAATAVVVMKQATKVLLGAHALLSNGFVMSRIGCSAIALAARDFNVPVLVCCETYKFYERVQTDAFLFNELGDPNCLVPLPSRKPVLEKWEETKSLNLLSLMYDITPPDLISALVTELGAIPCSSVPVVLRMQQMEADS